MIMLNRYSIAEARNNFASLVRDVETATGAVAVTRRGKTVAVILAINEYRRLSDAAEQRDFWTGYQVFRQKWANEEIDIEEEIWEDVRDKSAATSENVWR
jgi:prevent-host-death family protein